MAASNVCPACGKASAPTSTFCVKCGARLAAPAAGPVGPPPQYPFPPPPAYGYPPQYPYYAWPPPPRATFSDMLSGMFRVWAGNFVNFFVVYLGVTLATGLIGAAVSYVLFGVFTATGILPGLTPGAAVGLLLISVVATMAISLVLSSIVIGGMTEYAVRRFRGEPMTLRQALQRGLARFLSILGANVVVTLIIYALVLVPLLLMVPLVIFGAGDLAALLTGVCLLFVWLMVGAIVALYVSVSLSLYAPVIMMENASAIQGLSRSWRMVKGHWLSLFGAVLVTGVLVSIITMAITAAAALIGHPVASIIATALATGIVGSWSLILYAVAYDLILRESSVAVGMPPPYYPPQYPYGPTQVPQAPPPQYPSGPPPPAQPPRQPGTPPP